MEIKGNTLMIIHDSGNIGHFFNDRCFSSMSYYLMNKNIINNIYIKTDCQKYVEIFKKNLINKIFSEEKNRSFVNFDMIVCFFYNENIPFYIDHIKNSTYIFENLITTKLDRNINDNYIEVFSHLKKNYNLYRKNNNIKNNRYDVTFLYRTTDKFERNIYNIEIFENILKIQNITYKLLDTSKYYSFLEIVDIFASTDNIISFHGCELTYGIFMEKNTKIIELTKKNHRENWWLNMEKKFTNYGLKYERFEVDVEKNNLYLNKNVCFNILITFLKLKISFFGASITEQKEGYVYQIKNYFNTNKNINIYQNGYGARYITDSGIINIDNVILNEPNYCFLDWFSTLLIDDISNLLIYINTIIYKFTKINCKLIFLFFPRKDMNNDRKKMYNSVQKYLNSINISYLDLSDIFNNNLEYILKDGIHTNKQGGIEYANRIIEYFNNNLNNINYPSIMPLETKYCNYKKLSFNHIINEYIIFDGDGDIVGFKIIKNKHCGIVDIFNNNIYYKSYNFWDRWCTWTRESLDCSLKINGKVKILLTNKNVDINNESPNIDWSKINKTIEIQELFYIGNLNIIDFK